ncbi:MAG: hypothetical protein V3V99_11030 [candidate division Zixibacteria bacterium]
MSLKADDIRNSGEFVGNLRLLHVETNQPADAVRRVTGWINNA